jgi:NitT/TauT family transport system permease protein
MTSTTGHNQKNSIQWYRRRAFYIALGVLAMLLIWQILSMIFSQIIIASPSATFQALVRLGMDGTLWTQFGYSLARLLIGLSIGAAAGITLGVLAGLNPRLRSFLEPMRWAVMTVPVIILTVLAMLWFGMGSTQVVFLISIITIPINYVNTLEGMLAVDARIIEMSTVYKLTLRLRLTEIYLPGIGSAIMAGLTLASGIAVRAAILAEFIGARNGIGHSLFFHGPFWIHPHYSPGYWPPSPFSAWLNSAYSSLSGII